MPKETEAEKLARLMGWEGPPPVRDEEDETQQARHEEAVVAYTLHPELFTKLQCANCLKTFAVSRANVATCGKRCRHERMRKMGLEAAIGRVTPKNPKDIKYVDRVWLGKEPLIVKPEDLSLADDILARGEVEIETADSSIESREIETSDSGIESREEILDISLDFLDEGDGGNFGDELGDFESLLS